MYGGRHNQSHGGGGGRHKKSWTRDFPILKPNSIINDRSLIHITKDIEIRNVTFYCSLTFVYSMSNDQCIIIM